MHTSNLYYACVYMMKSHGVIGQLYLNKIKLLGFFNKSSFLFPSLEMVTFL